MLDGDGWGADAVFARGVGSTAPTSRKGREKWGTPSPGGARKAAAGFAAWATGIFVFLAVYDSGVGALCDGVCAGHVGGGFFGSSGRA